MLQAILSSYKKALIRNPDFFLPYVGIAACYSLLEQNEKAHETVKELLRVNPKVSIEFVAMVNLSQQKADLEIMLDALRKAGLPEHSLKE